jgi:multiple sugar transport system ATP-binding protein
MSDIRLENVTKRFGRTTAVDSIDLHIKDGEFFCILGPPNAGKTTTLRLIVGLERPDSGTIYIDGESVNDVHPRYRDIAMIFQNLALYPDKTVFDNIAFPLRERKMPTADIRPMVESVAKTLHIEKLLDRKPGKLSGGERQRVAIARAIVRRPRAYLMDEPLANLDALLRLEMRIELKRLQSLLHQTMIYVTSDQVEAMSMADRIAVLYDGVLQQCDTPENVYSLPANKTVATIVGSPPMNFITSSVCRMAQCLDTVHPQFTLRADGLDHPLWQALEYLGQEECDILVGVRPEDVRVFDRPPSDEAIPARVSVVEPLGSETIVDIELGPTIIKAVIPPTQYLSEKQDVWLMFNMDKVHIMDVDTGARVYTAGQGSALKVLPVCLP